ncbi:aspartyl-phosphate phosphatase Spo0E family protein [Aquibacillus kalidii]|uniref:aspartyl-phosphate phosphatase Spo0E family protein n=1 Tax=Aquibacillus kalidii TaxID=2762597 RepID=UPI001644DCEA|nr:aspartyl-phosphate phosphatase Spo0E family protein [Aquibacillus kalidii]
MDKKLYLLQKIENCRADMIELSRTMELTSDAVINASVRLDYLLNELDRISEVQKIPVKS